MSNRMKVKKTHKLILLNEFIQWKLASWGARGPFQADSTYIFLGVKLTFVVILFGHVQLLRFVVVKFF